MSDCAKEPTKTLGIGKLGLGNFSSPRKRFRWTLELHEEVTTTNEVKEELVCPLTGISHFRTKTEEVTSTVVHPATWVKVLHRPLQEGDDLFQSKTNTEELLKLVDKETAEKYKNKVSAFSLVTTPKDDEELLKSLYRWLSEAYNFFDGTKKEEKPTTLFPFHKWTVVLRLYDGCGNELEKWTLHPVTPIRINFGELDYSTSEDVTIEVVFVYDNVKYESTYVPPLTQQVTDQLKQIDTLPPTE